MQKRLLLIKAKSCLIMDMLFKTFLFFSKEIKKRIVSVSKNEKQEVNKKMYGSFMLLFQLLSIFYFCFLVDYDCFKVNELVWIKIVQIVLIKFSNFFQNLRSHLINLKKGSSISFWIFQFSSSILNSLFLLCNFMFNAL